MNSHAEYRRHSYRPPAGPSPAPAVDAVVNHLAIERDPSLAAAAPAGRSDAGRRVAWVRPTDLMTYTGPIGRGIDLQAHLMRRARRTPIAGAKATTRAARHTVSRRSPTTATQQEGLQL